jgi:hypothetical protein
MTGEVFFGFYFHSRVIPDEGIDCSSKAGRFSVR